MSNIQYDKAKNELNKLVELFKSQDLPNKCSKVLLSNGNKPSSKWSLNNKLIMLANETMDARGFDQWKQIGRYVKKGTKAMYILAPRMITIKEQKETEEITKKVISGFLGIPVFKYEDTEGQEIEAYKPKVLPPLIDIAKKINVKVDYSELAQVYGAYGFYDPANKHINLSTFDFGTFFHELTHAVEHYLDKDKNPTTKENIPLKECIAELTSCVLCSLYGIESETKNNYSYNYIKMYANVAEQQGTDNEKIHRLILKVLAKVDEILQFMLN